MTTQAIPSVSTGLTYEQLMEAFRVSREEFIRSKEESDAKWRMSKEKSDAEWLEIRTSMQETARIVQETTMQMKETDRKMQETDRKMQETDRKMKETDRQIQATNKKISELGDRIGEIVEVMVEGGIVRKFRELGYPFTQCARRVEFENRELEISGELDLFLENGDCALAVEVKTNFSMRDIQAHVKRLEKFSRYARAKGDKRRFFAAVGGAVVRKEVQEYAMKQGIYVIIQSGEAVEIAALPKGFKAKIW